MLKRIFCLSLFLSLSLASFAQSGSDNPYSNLPFKERLFFGGDFGLSFGSVTYIRIAPLVGYAVSPKFSLGLGPSYQYWKYSDFPDSEQSIWGGTLFARYFVLESLFLQSDLEVLNLEAYNFDAGETLNTRVTVPVWWVGAGYSQRSSNGSGIFVAVFYDLIQDLNSPYADNVAIRVGGFISLR